MTGRFRFGKMSTGMRKRARIEPRPIPTTNTMIVNGRRSAARSSHMPTALPGCDRVRAEGRAGDHLAKPRPKPNSAKPRAAQEHHQLQLEQASFAPPQRKPASPALLANVRV